MNWKKYLLSTLTLGVAFTGLLSMASISQASIANPGKYLKMDNPTYRKSGYAYRAGIEATNGENKELHMWKIYEYNDSNYMVKKNTNNAIYCLKMGVGFGSDGASKTEGRVYSKYADMKNPINETDKGIIAEYKETLPNRNEENYNSLIWLLDHCYVPAKTNSPTTEETNAAKEYKKQLLNMAQIPSDSILLNEKYEDISNDLIDIVQQLAIWYFTNNDQYQANTINEIGLQNTTDTQLYTILDDFFDTKGEGDKAWDVIDELNKLYSYLVNTAKANINTNPSTTAINPIQLNSTSAKVVATSNNVYIAGPYTITENNTNVVYSIEGSLTGLDNANIEYKLLDENRAEQSNLTLASLAKSGKQFYLKISSTKEELQKITFTIKTKIKQNTLTYWEVNDNASNNEQPVVEIVPEEKQFKIETILQLSEFDLALRKFITKINSQNVQTSREPQITEQILKDLQEGKTNTITKTHTKDPLEVRIGDIVTYTIRIYNEGELDGYASEVTDFLPKGLEFIKESDTNNEYGWKVSEDGRTVTTEKLKELLIPKFNGTEATGNTNTIKVQKIQKGENIIYYLDLQIECEVVASTSEVTQSLKNVAEITKAEDEQHQTITDRDSMPNNLTDEQKNNYHPESSTQGWGYQDDDDYEELVLPGKYFDLALRKFITNINGKDLLKEDNTTYTREPNIDLTPLQDGSDTTASYKHPKNPIGVSIGDIVTYTLRIYNEGQIDGYANLVTDYLPPQLEFIIDDDINVEYQWLLDSSERKVTTDYLKRNNIDPEENLIQAFDGKTLHYKELKINCRVVSTQDLDKVITNIAEISDFTDQDGNTITDRDSQKANVTLPSDEKLPDYKGNENNKSVLTDAEYFYQGQQDDDDFEKLILEEFDLALRKFITKVNETPVTNRVPTFTNVKDKNGNYIYEHTKEPIEVDSTDIVEYTIRIYNEGDIAGYAKEIKDDIPSGLEFLPDNATNKEYRWVMLDENGEKTEDVTKAKYITTDYLSKEQEKAEGENLIEAFDGSKISPDYKEVKVAFKVVALDSYEGIITNIAEISDDSDEDGNKVEDRDSTPNNNNEKEDDIDKEHLKLSYFDLALRKFITGVNDKEVTSRIPQFKITEDGKYTYEHTKEPVEVANNDIVIYTLRIYNEGTKDGYAKEIKDDLPEGLEFLPEHETNKMYRWVMLDENEEETDDITKAVSIKTDYLSKEQGDLNQRDNLLKQFVEDTMKEPDYRDIKIAFKVAEPNTSNRILINQAQISDDSDKDGNDIIDKDSTPDRWIEGEDDQDIEKVKVKYFDLALRKWVTEAIVIDNGKETVTQTGHKPEDNPEEVVKVEIKESRLNKVVVKFRYKIRITNEGEIAGYAEEISDYIPEGLKFVAADNPKWKETNGKIVTDQLKDTLLEPGESAEVEVLLTWINGKNNFGLKVNVAEISKDKNDSNTPDIDSTPNNQKPGEDDIDDAPVILSIKTGVTNTITYVTLTAVCLGILSSAVILIKKYIL